MKTYKLPVDYTTLTSADRKEVREQYVKKQKGNCYYCNTPLANNPPKHIKSRWIDWSIFPPNFLKYPIHLQHNHTTGMTEGAVHAYCNAVMWQYLGK